MPVITRLKVVSLADAPAQASTVPEDDSVLVSVDEDRSVRSPVNTE